MDLMELARRCRKSGARYLESEARYLAAAKEGADALVEYAADLYAARQAHASTQAFGAWLIDQELDDVGKNDRAALVKLGAPDVVEMARTISMKRQSISPRMVWAAVEEELARRVPTTGISAGSADQAPEAPETTSTTAENAEPAEPECAELVSMSLVKPVTPAPRAPRSAFKGLPEADLVHAHITEPHTRTMVSKVARSRKGRVAWGLLVESITSGAFGGPSSASVSRPTLRMILPWAPAAYSMRFDLTEVESQQIVQRDILPVVQVHRDTLHRDPSQLQAIVSTALTAREKEATARREAARHAAASAALPPGEKPIVAFGETLWPWPWGGDAPWTYREAREAAWFFNAALKCYQPAMTGAVLARATRLHVKWTPRSTGADGSTKGWAEAVSRITIAYEKTPDGVIVVAPAPPNTGLD